MTSLEVVYEGQLPRPVEAVTVPQRLLLLEEGQSPVTDLSGAQTCLYLHNLSTLESLLLETGRLAQVIKPW